MSDLRLAIINSDGKSRPPLPDPDGLVSTLLDLRFRVMARTPYDHLFTELGTLDAAEGAIAQGCDGIYVDTFGDYALERIRAITDVPVVGAGEATIRAAARLGRFSVVTVWPRSMRWLYDERLATVDGGGSCVGVHHWGDEDELARVGTGEGVKARMIRGEGAVVDDLVSLCRDALARDGSDAIALGCTCMSPVAPAVAERLEVPVLDPARVGLAEAHARVLGGERSAGDRFPVGRPGLAAVVVDACLAVDGLEPRDECEVCVVAPPGQAGHPTHPS